MRNVCAIIFILLTKNPDQGWICYSKHVKAKRDMEIQQYFYSNLHQTIPKSSSGHTVMRTFGCESWNLTAAKERMLQAFEMKCLWRILKLSYIDHKTNDNVWLGYWMKRPFIHLNDASVKGWMLMDEDDHNN